MRLKEKKGTKVPHALSVKLCMRSHGCAQEIVMRNKEVLKIDEIKKFSPGKLKKFMDSDGIDAMFYQKKDVKIPDVGAVSKDKFIELSPKDMKKYLDKYGYDFLDGVDLST